MNRLHTVCFVYRPENEVALKWEQKITPKTKAIIINSPCNPSGAVIEEKELQKISELAAKNDLYLISDEIYEYQSEQAGWYEIILPSAATGWVFGDYVELINQ